MLTANTTANAAPNDGPFDSPPLAAEEVVVTPSATSGDPEELALPPVPTETQEYLNELQLALDDDPQFSAVEISEDRAQITVWWHGDPSGELSALLDSSPQSVEQVRLEQTALLPGDLRSAAQDVLRQGAALGVERVTVAFDGSHLEVGLAGGAASRRSTPPPDKATQLAKITDVPLTITQDGGVEPAVARLTDNYHIGGARVYNYNKGLACTSGFAVEKGSAKGTMFAVHCGSVGDLWVITDSQTAFAYGTTESRHTGVDGAIMASAGNFSQPYVWVGPYDNSLVFAINGSAYPGIGSEICYSGSYSGTVCGNIVTAKDVYTNLQNDLTSVRSIVTSQSSGLPAAGSGDSGGPGYIYTTSSSGTSRWATSIISAIPDNSGTTCNGVAGSTATGGRRCSSTVYSTAV